jgi:drug/metabolite transporter (DMT)-like permease
VNIPDSVKSIGNGAFAGIGRVEVSSDNPNYISLDGNLYSKDRKTLLLGGLFCGLALFSASTLQQYGIFYTSAGKAGFITSLYAVIVPILSIALGKKVRPIVWVCVALGVIGLYLLSIEPGTFSLQLGDLMVLLCALVFSFHILIIDYFSPRTDAVKLSCLQFLIAGGLGIIGMFLFEEPVLADILSCSIPILYAGILSCGVAYTLQIIAQKNANPTEASLILCLEAVFSMLTGAVLLKERMPVRGYIGCLLIFTAVLISQLPEKSHSPKKN